MIFVLVFSALAVSLATVSGTNVQLANNQHKANLAFCAAQSGLEVLRYWLAKEPNTISGKTDPEEKMQAVQSNLQNKFNTDGVTNIRADYKDSTNTITTITIPAVTLDANTGQNFGVVFSLADSGKKLQAKITGACGDASKQVIVDFNFVTVGNGVFDYGVATKGPLNMVGNVGITGADVLVDSKVYIESENQQLALTMQGGKASIGGEVNLYRSDATVDVDKKCSIGGLTGDEAVAQNVHKGVEKAEFPIPCPEYFEHYVENTYEVRDGVIVNTNTDGKLTNTKILAGTNPKFTGGTINGVLYIEKPNTVEFTGNVVVNGIIITEGDIDDPSPSQNTLTFRGTVDSNSVDTLPDNSHFSGLRNEKGTFIMAPGFSVSFGGDFRTVNGTIAANGVEFFGTAGGKIYGSVINYSTTPMTLTGSSDLYFNRSGTEENPAGFSPHQKLVFMSDSYSESL
jgi:type II secretory pathway pseudopilin PulG